jgi:hemin uptake protein HemP
MSYPPNRINLSDLMRDKKKLILEQGDKPYLLSITRNGRFFLTAAYEEKESVESIPNHKK